MKKAAELFVSIIFSVVGIAITAGGWYAYQSQKKFVAIAQKTSGVVTALEYSRSRKGGGSYYPIVEFQTPEGRTFSFRSDVGSNPAPYDRGEQVEVLYNPHDPNEAKLTGFWNLWGLAAIFAGLGSVFTAIGIGTMVASIRRRKMIEEVKMTGSSVELPARVEYNRSKGRKHYYLRSEWLNPTDGKMYLFDSDPISYDPTPFVQGRSVRVWYDPSNPKKRHYVDTSFLPEKA
ncbi:DUF3592 domain-containing protein [Runella sp.]|uniref:DUF3592 domain-containing protein n=1 Tax=Runella sp. TaxID=1960881 RepID=UPI003D13041D